MASPQVLSTGVFVTVLRMLVIMCASCPDLAVMLLKQSKLSAFLCHVCSDAQVQWLIILCSFLTLLIFFSV